MPLLPVVKEQSLPKNDSTVEWTHTVDRQEQMYMVSYMIWLIPTILFHLLWFVIKTSYVLLQQFFDRQSS